MYGKDLEFSAQPETKIFQLDEPRTDYDAIAYLSNYWAIDILDGDN